MNQPTIETHIPVHGELPEEPVHEADRKDIPVPSLWQPGVRVFHRQTKRRAVIVRADHATNMFRAFYPDDGPLNEAGVPEGRFSTRTEWEQFANWEVETTFSPRELERQAAAAKLSEEIAQLDPTSLAAVSVLCDDTDPVKALAKLEALRALGVVKASAAAARVVVEAVNKKGGK